MCNSDISGSRHPRRAWYTHTAAWEWEGRQSAERAESHGRANPPVKDFLISVASWLWDVVLDMHWMYCLFEY